MDTETQTTPEVLIVGAGLAGLCCARRLQESGISFHILEASAAIGGRVRTDRVEGFLLDHGFQVLLTAYPEAQRVLDYAALELYPFYPGALVRHQGAFHRVVDPWRRPKKAIGAVCSPVGTLKDKLGIARLRRRVQAGSLDDLFRRPETSTLQALQDAGFSASIIDRFFRPFFGGIFLERNLRTSSRMFEFVFRMLALGDIALPAGGMGAIPEQLAASLPDGTIRTKVQVTAIHDNSVTLASGERLSANAVVVATEGPEAARLLYGLPAPGSRSVTCLYFAADTPPLSEPILLLNSEETGPVNNLCVPSVVAPSYAPPGAALISATVLGNPYHDDATLESAVRAQMCEWFGSPVTDWRHLRTYRILHAQPEQSPPTLTVPERPVQLQPGLFVCGDHRDTASIQGAMVSGRRAAEAVLAELGA
jgi:phytoene dehydrogenase-like protein